MTFRGSRPRAAIRRGGAPVRTSTRRKLCPSIGKLLGKSASLPRSSKAGSSVHPQLPQDGDSVSLPVESAVDEIIAWRMAKAQQMRWSKPTVQPFLDVRTAVLNDT